MHPAIENGRQFLACSEQGIGAQACSRPDASQSDFLKRVEAFPRGLLQPEGGYRFGADALLLAAFSHKIASRQKQQTMTVAELGCGCGAALIGFGLLNQNAICFGYESEAELLACARRNIHNFGMCERVKLIHADIEIISDIDIRGLNLVMANPPWLRPGAGRLPKSPLRRKALCQRPDTLNAFCSLASRLLERGGYFCLVLPPTLLTDICACLENNRFGLRQVLPVASRANQAAIRILCLGRKETASDPIFLPPLYLHESASQRWTKAALEFCPWLAPWLHP